MMVKVVYTVQKFLTAELENGVGYLVCLQDDVVMGLEY